MTDTLVKPREVQAGQIVDNSPNDVLPAAPGMFWVMCCSRLKGAAQKQRVETFWTMHRDPTKRVQLTLVSFNPDTHQIALQMPNGTRLVGTRQDLRYTGGKHMNYGVNQILDANKGTLDELFRVMIDPEHDVVPLPAAPAPTPPKKRKPRLSRGILLCPRCGKLRKQVNGVPVCKNCQRKDKQETQSGKTWKPRTAQDKAWCQTLDRVMALRDQLTNPQLTVEQILSLSQELQTAEAEHLATCTQ